MTGYSIVKIDEHPPTAGWINADDPRIKIPASTIWKRLEHWCDYPRWGVRNAIVYLRAGICDPNGFVPPLGPVVSVNGVDRFVEGVGGGWSPIPIRRGPFDGILDLAHFDSYRLDLTVGHEAADDCVNEAFWRLHDFLAADRESGRPAGVSRYSVNLGGELSESYSLPIERVARAITLSGAADLLRSYKRVNK